MRTQRVRPRGLLIVIAALLARPAMAAPPAAGGGEIPQATRDEARSRFNRAVELYADGDFKLALIEFERAYSLVPNSRLLYNVGQVNLQLHNYSKALEALERYLAEGGEEVPKARRAEVEKTLESLRQRTAVVTLLVSEAGAEISIDDVVVGHSPLERPLTLDAGEHRFAAKKAGFEPSSQRVVLAGRDTPTVELVMRVQAAVAAAPPSGSADAAARSGRSPLFYVGWIGAGSLATAAAITGGLALSEAATLKDMRENTPTPAEELDAAASKARSMALATDILAVSAVAATSVMVYFTWLRPTGKTEGPALRARGPWLGVTGTF